MWAQGYAREDVLHKHTQTELTSVCHINMKNVTETWHLEFLDQRINNFALKGLISAWVALQLQYGFC